jgi:hypothetical protein
MELVSGPLVSSFIPSDNFDVLAPSKAAYVIGSDGSKYVIYISESYEAYALKNPDGTSSAIVLPLTSSRCAYLAKYDSNDIPLWAAQINMKGALINRPNLIIDNVTNSVYLALDGSNISQTPLLYNSDGSASSIQLNTFASDNKIGQYVIKYNNQGFIQLVLELQGIYWPNLGLDKTGNIYVSGEIYNSDIYILSSAPASSSTHILQNGDQLLAKFSQSGILIWAKMVTGTSDTLTLTINKKEQVYFPTKYSGKGQIYDAILLTSQPLPTLYVLNEYIGLILKLDVDGNLIWTVQLPKFFPAFYDSISLTIDSQDSIYCVFQYRFLQSDPLPFIKDATNKKHILQVEGVDYANTTTLTKISADGVLLWYSLIKTTATTLKTSIVSDYKSNVIFSFRYSGADTIIINSNKTTHSLPTPAYGNTALTIIAFDPNGLYLWSKIPMFDYSSSSPGQLSVMPNSFKVLFLNNTDGNSTTYTFHDGEEYITPNTAYGGYITLTYSIAYPESLGGITTDSNICSFVNAASSNDVNIFYTDQLQTLNFGLSNSSNTSMMRVDNNRIIVKQLEVTDDAIIHQDIYVVGDVHFKGTAFNNDINLRHLTIDLPSSSNIDPIKQWSLVDSSHVIYKLPSSLSDEQNGLLKLITNKDVNSNVHVDLLDVSGNNVLNTFTILPQNSIHVAWYGAKWYNIGA